MVHRRKERPAEGYRIHITVPGHGTLGPWQTGFHRKRDAARVEDDTRTVRLTPAECTRLLDACDPERFRWLVTVALGTAADRGPLLAMQSRQFSDREGTLEVRDAKTAHRPRVLRVVGDVRLVLRLASAGLRPLERLFPWSDNQVQWLWKKARKAAELEHVRFKDLRHVLPTELAALGVDRREIESLLGHAPGSKMTGRYITPVGLVGRLEEATARMGMSGRYLRVE